MKIIGITNYYFVDISKENTCMCIFIIGLSYNKMLLISMKTHYEASVKIIGITNYYHLDIRVHISKENTCMCIYYHRHIGPSYN